MFKLLIDVTNVGSGGGIQHISNLLCYIPRDFEVTLITTARNSSFFLNSDATVVEKSWRGIFGKIQWIFWQYFSLRRLVRRNNFDAVFSPGGILITRSIPSVVLFQNSLPFMLERTDIGWTPARWIKMLCVRMLFIRSFRSSSRIIVLNQFGRNLLCSTDISESKLDIIGHGIEKLDRQPAEEYFYNCDRRRIRAVYVSPMHPYKKHEMLVIYLIQYVERRPDFFLEVDFVGQVDSEIKLRCKKYLASSTCNRLKVNFKGNVNREVLTAGYKLYDVGFFFSTCENFPITCLEYISSGMPFLTFDLRPMSEYTFHSRQAIRYGDFEQFCHSLDWMVSGGFPLGPYRSWCDEILHSSSLRISAEKTYDLMRASFS